MNTDSLSEVLAAVYRRRTPILFMVLGSIMGAEYYLQSVGTFWQATASLLVPGETTRMSLTSESESLPEGPVVPDLSEETRVGIMGLIHSNLVAIRALENMGYADLLGEERAQAVTSLRRQVVADLNLDQLLVVSVMDRDRNRASRVANAFATALRQVMREMAERGPLATLASLEKEEPLSWSEYAAARRERLNILELAQSPDPDIDTSLLVAENQRLKSSIRDLEVESAKISAQLPIVQREIEARPGEMQIFSQTLVENPSYTQALKDVSRIRVELEILKLKYRERRDAQGNLLPNTHPELERAIQNLESAQRRVEDEAQIASVVPTGGQATGPLVHASTELRPDEQLQALLNRLVDLHTAQAGVEPSLTLMRLQLAANQAELDLLPGTRQELSRIDLEIERLHAYASQISQRVEELRLVLDQGLEFTFFEEHQKASPSSAREVPKRPWVFFFAVAASLAAGLTLALGMELLARARLSRPW
ncbi:MAG TPA: hypothetical protein QGG59_10780 [Planctomycetota bacterium]|jgi:hypothetical protein|nr:hypothetical protein [Planctomycetota bacterium]MDP7245074.1 hypothetical protein [Planctomycetota bacterium]HJM40581.1 hypothetical protein [Planctomycetota bacterium]